MITETNKEYIEYSKKRLTNEDWDKLVDEEVILILPCKAFTAKGLEMPINDKTIYIPTDEISTRMKEHPQKKAEGMRRVGSSAAFVLKKNEKGYYGSRITAHDKVTKQLFEMESGTILDGTITAIVPYGAFVDIGYGVSSLLPLSNISVVRITHPSDMLEVGMDIKVVLRQSEDVLTLSLKELLPIWEEYMDKFHVGDTVEGIVRYKADYGTYISLAENFYGLTAAEDNDKLTLGTKCVVNINSIKADKSKVKLSIVNPNIGKADMYTISYGSHANDGVLKDWVYNSKDMRS